MNYKFSCTKPTRKLDNSLNQNVSETTENEFKLTDFNFFTFKFYIITRTKQRSHLKFDCCRVKVMRRTGVAFAETLKQDVKKTPLCLSILAFNQLVIYLY